MIRQNIKNQEYFNNYFESLKQQQERRKNLMDNDQVKPERLAWFKKSNFDILLDYTIADYTVGQQNEIIKKCLLTAISYLKESWSPEIVLINYNNIQLHQYTSYTYDQMLWMLSLGYLLEIDNEQFKKLVEVIDRDKVKDYLLEFIIRAKLQNRKPITTESYEHGWLLFGKLRQAITETNKSKAEKLVKEFVTKDWYKEHKKSGWCDSHKSEHDTYSGYWSFETAAVVKIMGLDDSSFIDCPYYPKDLVHQEK